MPYYQVETQQQKNGKTDGRQKGEPSYAGHHIRVDATLARRVEQSLTKGYQQYLRYEYECAKDGKQESCQAA
jgi:hypothetical protein